MGHSISMSSVLGCQVDHGNEERWMDVDVTSVARWSTSELR